MDPVAIAPGIAPGRGVTGPVIAALHQSWLSAYPNPDIECNKNQNLGYSYSDRATVFGMALLSWPPRLRIQANDDPLMFFLPVLDIQLTIWGEELFRRDRFLEACLIDEFQTEFPDLVEAWNCLRMIIYNSEQPVDCFLRYDSDHNGGRTQKMEQWSSCLARFERLIHQAQRLEVLMRDQIQARTASMMLDESRASIQQSKMALQEGRRTKLGKF